MRLAGHELGKIREKDAAAFRRDNLGFVFQEFNLLDTFTLEDNIYLPLVLMGMSYEDMRARLLPIARELGLTELLKKYPYEVSGGQKQRVSLAGVMVDQVKILLFDEPTSALDPELVGEVLDTIKKAANEGYTMLLVSHEMNFVKNVATRVIFLENGKIIEDGPPKEVFNHPKSDRVREFFAKINRMVEPEYSI